MEKCLPPPINHALIEKIAAASKASKLNSGKVVAVGPGSHDGEEKLLSAVSWNEGGEKKSSQTSSQQQRTKPAVRSSVNYVVVQYLLSGKNKMQFDPVLVLKHFKAPVAEPSTIAPLL